MAGSNFQACAHCGLIGSHDINCPLFFQPSSKPIRDPSDAVPKRPFPVILGMVAVLFLGFLLVAILNCFGRSEAIQPIYTRVTSFDGGIQWTRDQRSWHAILRNYDNHVVKGLTGFCKVKLGRNRLAMTFQAAFNGKRRIDFKPGQEVELTFPGLPDTDSTICTFFRCDDGDLPGMDENVGPDSARPGSPQTGLPSPAE